MKKILLFIGDLYFISAKTGVGAYQSNIIWGLKYDYDIVVPDSYSAKLPSNAHPIKISKYKRRIISLLKKFVPVSFFFKNYDYVVTGGNCFRKSSKTKQYAIIHDLMSFTEPKCYSFKQKIAARIEAFSYKQADLLIAVSQTTKQVLHDLFHIDFNKIFVCPNVTDFYIENKPTDYFLFIGDMRKNKNLNYLLYGFADYLKKDNSKKLIIAGSKKFEYEKLQKIVDEYRISESVIFPGYVTEEDKKKLYENAIALIFLSDNEGFGIPLLEAGVNRIPSLCSDIPVFHEVVNPELSVFVNNKNVESISNGFEQVCQLKISEDEANKLKNKYSKNEYNSLLNTLFE